MSLAVLLAGLAGACALLGAWEAIAPAEQERVLQTARRWCAPALDVLRSGREPTNPERRRLVALGTLSLLGAGWLVAGPVAALALAATAPWSARAVVLTRRRRRAAAVAAGAPAIARAVADALAGGNSVRGALSAAAGDGAVAGPAGEEMRSVAAALALGERTEDVLAGLVQRAGTGTGAGALDAVAAAMLLQREAGGDLAALLRDLAAALEERGRVAADARSATAQARFTALLVSGLPVAGLALGELVAPGFVAGLVSAPLTAVMVLVALALQALAFACITRIGRVQAAP